MFNGAVDGFLTGVMSVGIKGDYSECTRKYYEACTSVKRAKLGSLKTIKLLETERIIYKRNIWGVSKVNVESYMVSTPLSNGIKSGAKAIVKRRVIGQYRHYDPKTKLEIRGLIWG